LRARGNLWLAIHLLMKKIVIEAVLYIFVFLFVLLVPEEVFAHGGTPRLEISAERLSPGETLQIRGVDFEYDQEAAIALIGNQVEIPMGTVIADAEGVFIQNVLLPVDLAPGSYAVRARTYDHVVISPLITVGGTPITDEEETGIRDQSDLQLGPLPTVDGAAPAVATAAAPVSAAPVETPAVSSGRGTNALMLAGLMVLVALAVLALGKKRS
jgi:hypothetical protein